MAGIRGSDTRPERIVRGLLHSRGFRYRLNVRSLAGTPDIVLRRFSAAIFVHGCFWHGHDCPLFRLPATNTEFWLAKIRANLERDTRNRSLLIRGGWRVLVVWECALKGPARLGEDVLGYRVSQWLHASRRSHSIAGRAHRR